MFVIIVMPAIKVKEVGESLTRQKSIRLHIKTGHSGKEKRQDLQKAAAESARELKL